MDHSKVIHGLNLGLKLRVEDKAALRHKSVTKPNDHDILETWMTCFILRDFQIEGQSFLTVISGCTSLSLSS